MVANAGIGKLLSLVDMTVDVWDHIMCVNVRSVMLAYKHAARQMIKQGRGGRIVGAFAVPILPLRIICLLSENTFRCGVHGREEG